MDKSFFGSIGISIFLVVILLLLVYFLVRKIKSQPKKNIFNKIVDAILLPINFGALFLEKRKIEQLPFYYRWFLKFTKLTSKIHYFHFLPKFIVALASEYIISILTNQDILTAIVFSWSVLFLVIITAVESRSGELDEDSIIFANKLFLYTVSILTFSCILIYFFFWEGLLEPYLNSPFFILMGNIAAEFNEFLKNFLLWIWNSSIYIKLIIFFILIFYIFSSLFVSKHLKK
jgi:magnesium-transporting ATPase (P-type)